MDISVIIPTYNRANLIGETIRSILQQSLPPAEIIVIDDGSRDDTASIVSAFGPRVIYKQIANSGVCHARNTGANLAKSSYLAFCDSDDLWHPLKLELQSNLFTAAPDAPWSFTNFRLVVNGEWSTSTKFDCSPSSFWTLPRREINKASFVIETSLFERVLQHQPIFPSTLMMKRPFFEEIGGWTESLSRTLSEDLEFILRCAQRKPVAVLSTAVVGIRKHDANFSGDALLTVLGEIEVLKYVMRHHALPSNAITALHNQIVFRSMQAAEGSFRIGEMTQTRRLLADVPFGSRSFKLHVKNALTYCPAIARRCIRPTRSVA